LLLLGALVAVASAVVVRVNLERWTWRLVQLRLEEDYDVRAKIGHWRIHVLGLSAEFTDLEIETLSGANGRLDLSVPYGKARLSWRALAGLGRRHVHLAELRLVRPAVITDEDFFDRPRAQGESRSAVPIDIHIDQLELVSGSWTHEGTEHELELAAEGLDVVGSWAGDRRTMLGEIVVRAGVRGSPLGQRLALDVDSSFRWRGLEIELLGATASAPGIEIDFDSRLELRGNPVLSAAGSFSGDLDRLDLLMEEGFPEISGRVEGSFEATLGPDPLHVTGELQAVAPRLDRFVAARASAHVDYSPGHLSFGGIEAGSLRGTVEGSVGLRLGAPVGVDVDLRARKIDTLALLDWLGLPLLLDGEADAELRLTGRAGAVASWEGEGRFTVRADEAGLPVVPVRGDGTLRLSGGRLELRAQNGGAAATIFRAELDTDLTDPRAKGYLLIEGETVDARRTQLATVAILEQFGVVVPEFVARPLHGRGTFRARSLFGGETDVELDLGLASGAFASQRFERMNLSVRLSDEETTVPNLEIVDGDTSFVGSARLKREPLSILELDLRASRLDASALLPLLQIETDLEGRLTGELSTEPGPDGAHGLGFLRLAEGSWFGEPFDEIAARVQMDGERVCLEGLTVTAPAMTAHGGLTLNQRETSATLRIDTATVDLGALSAVEGFGALLHLAGNSTFDSSGVIGGFTIEGEALHVGEVELGGFSGGVELDPDGLTAHLRGDADPGWLAEGSLAWEPELPLRASLLLRETILDLPVEYDSPVWTRLSGRLELEGPLRETERWTVGGSLQQAELHLGPHRLDLDSEVPFSLTGQQFEMGPLSLRGPDSEAEISARYDLSSEVVDARAQGRLGLRLLSAILPEVRAVGSAAADLRIRGRLDAPDVSGSLSVESGRLRHLGFPHTLEQIETDISFSGSEATIDSFRGLVGGGEIEGRGRIGLGLDGIESVRLELSGSNVRVAIPEGFEGVYEGTLSLTGDADELTLGGRLTMLRGLYEEEFELGSLFGSATREYSAEDRSALPDNVALDIGVRADGNLWVRNEIAEVENRFDLHVGGTLRRPEITGRLGMIEGGTLRFRDVTYRIRSGSLDFTDPEGLNPYIHVTAQTTVGSYEVSLRVEGTLDEIEYDLTSNPSLSQQDIIALLTTGKTLQELTASDKGGGDAQFTGDLAASYFAGALTAPFERQLRRALGLDLLQINPLLIEAGDPTTRVTVGKRVRDDVLVIVSAQIGSTEDRLYQVEWRASRKFVATFQRDTNGGIGSNLLYTDRYWWKRPPGEREKAVPAERPREELDSVSAVVGTLGIEGVPADETKQLRNLIRLEQGEPFQRSTMFEGVEAIRRHYVKRDRLQARVESHATPSETSTGVVDVRYEVEPGPEIQVRFEGLKKKEERRLRSALEHLWEESLFSGDLYADSVARIRREFQERGFYAVDVQYTPRGEGGAQEIEFEIDRGKPVRVQGILITGANQVPEDRIRKQMLTRPPSLIGGAPFNPEVLDEDVSAIRNLYLDQGFLDIRIDEPRVWLSAAGDSVEISLTIEEGPRFTISAIEFSGEQIFERERLLEWCALTEDEPFSTSELLEAESGLRRGFDRDGYPDAKIRGAVDVGSGQVLVRFEIDPGVQKRLSGFRISGNDMTKESVIRREMKLSEGDPISREELLRGQHRLYRLGIFRNVRVGYEPAGNGDPNAYLVHIDVEEQRPISLTIGVGYNTEADFKFSFATSYDNLNGKARSIGFQGEFSGILSRLQLLARTPRLFGASVPALSNLLWEREEKEGFTVERKSAALRVDRRVNQRWRGFLRYNLQRVDLLDVLDPGAPAEEREEDIILGDVGAGLFRVTRDSLLLPTRGNYLELGFRFFAKPLLSEADFIKAQLTESQMWTFRNGTAFVTVFRIGFAPPLGSTEEVPISERFFAGGDSTNRGFGRDELGPKTDSGVPLGGEGLLLFNEEFRFPIWRRMRLKGTAFYDAGNVYFSLSDFDPTNLRHTLGGGLRLETPIGPIRAEYGWKLDREEGESSGQFHFAIGAVY